MYQSQQQRAERVGYPLASGSYQFGGGAVPATMQPAVDPYTGYNPFAARAGTPSSQQFPQGGQSYGGHPPAYGQGQGRGQGPAQGPVR